MTRRPFRFMYWLFLALLLVGGLHGALAQTSTATVEGSVVDVSGAGIPNAVVTVKNTGTGQTRVDKADESGRYFVNSLIPGSYQVTAEVPNFSTKVLKDITLNVGADVKLDIALTIGETSTVVEVQGQALLVDTQGSSNGTIIDNKAVVELPVVNRQFYSLAQLAPGVAPPGQNSTLGFRGGFNVAGASEISNQFTLNGTYNNDMGVGQPSFRPSLEVIQEFKLLTGVYPAEYGRMSGGQLNIITKSGSNRFHGSVYEYIRNQATDAKPFFTPSTSKIPALRQNTFGATLGGPIWKDKTFFFFGYEGQRIGRAVTALAQIPSQNQLAGLITAPTGSKRYNPATGAVLVPTSSTAGIDTYNLASSAYTDASGTPLWNTVAGQAGRQIASFAYPTTSASAISPSVASNYTFSGTRVENMNEESLRVDHKLTDKDSLNGTWNYFRDPAFEPSNTLCSSRVLPKFGCFTNQYSTLTNIVYDRILTPNLLNEVRIGFQRLVQPRITEDNTAIGSSYPGLPGGPYFTQPNYANNLGLPQITVSGLSTAGGATNLPQKRWDDHYQIVDVATWNHGNHTVKAGLDMILVRSTNIITSTGRGGVTFSETAYATTINPTCSATAAGCGAKHFGYTLASTSGTSTAAANDGSTTSGSIADLLWGYASATTIGTTAGTVYMNFQSYHAFLQDDWKVTPYLTINAGLRYELDRPVYSPSNTASMFNTYGAPNAPAFIQAGPNTFRGYYNVDRNNFAPRLGFALQPFSKDSTVLKGAFGMFYNMPLLYNQFLNLGTQYPLRLVQNYNSTGAGSIALSNPFATPGGTALSPCTTLVTTYNTACSTALSGLEVERRYSTPYISEWSLGVQQALTKSIVGEITYFGSKGSKLPLSVNLNQINIANVPLAQRNAARRPFPGFVTVSSQDTRSNSNYNSLQASLRKTPSKGVAFQVSYTYAKSIDGGGGIGSGSDSSGGPQNVYNLRAERGLSDFDIRQRFVFSPVAELPFGKNKAFLNHGPAAAIAGGFQVSAIFSFQTGRPFTITNNSSNISQSFSGTGTSSDRPDTIGDPNAGPKTAAKWFNTAAFASQAAGTFGNTGRNSVFGPRYTQLDFTLSRNFAIWESLKGQFRAEGFNVFNHPNLFNPSGNALVFGQSSFGQITQAQDNREFQFGLRLLF